MSSEIIEVFAGDLTPIKNARPDFPGVSDSLDAAWICTTSVVDCDNEEVIANRVVTTKMTDAYGRERFTVSIFPAETALLTVPEGEDYVDYNWIIEITNATTIPEYSKEARFTLRVRRQGIT